MTKKTREICLKLMISEINDINKIIMRAAHHTRKKKNLGESTFKHKELSTYKIKLKKDIGILPLHKRALIRCAGHWRTIPVHCPV